MGAVIALGHARSEPGNVDHNDLVGMLVGGLVGLALFGGRSGFAAVRGCPLLRTCADKLAGFNRAWWRPSRAAFKRCHWRCALVQPSQASRFQWLLGPYH